MDNFFLGHWDRHLYDTLHDLLDDPLLRNSRWHTTNSLSLLRHMDITNLPNLDLVPVLAHDLEHMDNLFLRHGHRGLDHFVLQHILNSLLFSCCVSLGT